MSNQSSLMPEETQRPRKSSRKHSKPIVVQWRAKGGRSSLFFRDWSKFGRYKDEATAEGVLRQKQHDRWFEYRIQPNE
jgi:hypothetical protein